MRHVVHEIWCHWILRLRNLTQEGPGPGPGPFCESVWPTIASGLTFWYCSNSRHSPNLNWHQISYVENVFSRRSKNPGRGAVFFGGSGGGEEAGNSRRRYHHEDHRGRGHSRSETSKLGIYKKECRGDNKEVEGRRSHSPQIRAQSHCPRAP